MLPHNIQGRLYLPWRDTVPQAREYNKRAHISPGEEIPRRSSIDNEHPQWQIGLDVQQRSGAEKVFWGNPNNCDIVAVDSGAFSNNGIVTVKPGLPVLP